MKRVACLLLLASGLTASTGTAQERPLPLPEAPVLLVIPDAAAFDQALSGGFRKALSGSLPANDPVALALRRTRVGEKLAAQWELFSRDLPLTWPQIRKLSPSSLGLALLSAGDLEAVLVVRTTLAPLPLALPSGRERQHKGLPYRVTSSGAGDDRSARRRMGLAYAQHQGDLILATSERAMKLALERAVSASPAPPSLPGLASLRLDLEALRRDLYFRRELLFDEASSPSSGGILLCALTSVPGGGLVEIRRGEGESRGGAPIWETEGREVLAAGWETDGRRLLQALRRGILEPIPAPAERPVLGLAPLPVPDATGPDRYLVDLRKPDASAAGPGETGELPRWKELLSRADGGFGWELSRGEVRRLVLTLPASADDAFLALAEETVRRQAGDARRRSHGSHGITEIVSGPDLPAVATRRTGSFLWVSPRASDLIGVPTPKAEPTLGRWSRLDLTEARRLEKPWAAAEGRFNPEETRPFSDRVLGLLGWMPRIRLLTVERRLTGGAAFEERVTFLPAAVVRPGGPGDGASGAAAARSAEPTPRPPGGAGGGAPPPNAAADPAAAPGSPAKPPSKGKAPRS